VTGALRTAFALAAMGWMATPQNQTFENVEVHVLPVQGNVYMLVGAGGNITVQAGNEGVLLVDTSFEQMSDKVVAAIRNLSDKPIRYIINTHAHPDHVGGNAPIAKLGMTIAGGNMGTGASNSAAIIAHENVLNRMSAPPGPPTRTSPRKRSCSSTASRSRSFTNRPPTPTATASSSSVIPMSSAPAISSSPRHIRSSTCSAAETFKASSAR